MVNLGAVLVTGLFAGGVSCAAVQGGLLTGLVTRQRSETASAAGGPVDGRAAVSGGGKTGSTAVATATKSTAPAGKFTRRTAEPPGSFRTRLADDLTPVGSFLAGKLVTHTLLGALLGALGSAVQLSTRVTTIAQIGAGLLIVAFGLGQLGVPGFRTFTLQPPASWARFVRGRARSSSALAPALLGATTILIPCGVTLSVEALALTSGSPLAGAATMATFVFGTSPLFATLGYVARKAATVWQGRLTIITGLVVLAMGLYTLNTGLVRAGSPLTARTVALELGWASNPPTAETVTVADNAQQAIVTARPGSYSPDNIAVKAGVPTKLIVRSKNAAGCIRAFVIPSLNKQWVLPENGDTVIELGILQPGTFDYTCGMGMYSGVLTIT